jgi:hypothetical protein
MDIRTATSKEALCQHYEEYQKIQDILMDDLNKLSIDSTENAILFSKQRNETIRGLMGILGAKDRIAMTLDEYKEKE